MIFAIELKRYMINANIFGIIIGKLDYKKKPYLIILFKVNKDSKISFYYTILFLGLSVCL